ncbi:hypothetical protein JCM5350_002959 [Sporobolomyces pararoseus]
MSGIHKIRSNDFKEFSPAYHYAKLIMESKAYTSAHLSERALWNLKKVERISYWRSQDCRRIVERVEQIGLVISEQAENAGGGIDDVEVKETAKKIFKALQSVEKSIGINYLLPKNFELIVRKLRNERIFGNDQNGSGVLWSVETFMKNLRSPSSFRRVLRKMSDRPSVLQTRVEGRIALLVDLFQVTAVRMRDPQAFSKDWRKKIQARLEERFLTWPDRLSNLDEWYPLWDYVCEDANINNLVDSLLPLDMPPRAEHCLRRDSRIGLRQASRHELVTFGYAKDGGLFI